MKNKKFTLIIMIVIIFTILCLANSKIETADGAYQPLVYPEQSHLSTE